MSDNLLIASAAMFTFFNSIILAIQEVRAREVYSLSRDDRARLLSKLIDPSDDELFERNELKEIKLMMKRLEIRRSDLKPK